ncbi:hypothetical protein DYB28_000888, partial [Aphanomyces astaci]
MTTIAPTTQTFNDDIDATGVAQQRPRGEPVHADMTAAATAPTTETADSKGLVLRIASLSVKAFVGLVLEWLSVRDTPTITGVSVRDIPSPPRVRRGLELHFASSTASVNPLLLPTHITSSDSAADTLLAPANDALIQDHAATHIHPFDLSFDHSAHEHVLPELLKEDQDPNERSTDAARLDQSPFLSNVK